MRYLKLYENFTKDLVVEEEPEKVELSNITIDDVLSDDFINSFKDSKEDEISDDEIVHLKNWSVY